jgi:hypothetical protein
MATWKKVVAGRRVIGEVSKTGDVYHWSSSVSGDGGVTDSLVNAKKRIAREAGGRAAVSGEVKVKRTRR